MAAMDPIRPAHTGHAPVPSAPGPAGAGSPRILIVEDDPATAASLARAAEALGARPRIEESFGAGLAAAEAGDYAVIVLDRMLPGGDGIEAVARLRAAGNTA